MSQETVLETESVIEEKEKKAAKSQKSLEDHKKTKTPPHVTKSLVLAIVISGTGFLQYGYNYWVLHFPNEIMKNFSNDTETKRRVHSSRPFVVFLHVLSISLYPLGGIIGSIIFAPMADKSGRRMTLMINNCFTMVSALLMGVSKMVEVEEFSFFSRLVAGITSGIAANIVPVYLSEIAHKDWRGAINVFASFFFLFGIFIGQLFTSPQILGNDKGWPLLKSFSGLIAVCQIFLLFSIHESPRYLQIQKRKEQKAMQALIALKGQDDVQEELEDLVLEDHAERSEKKVTVRKFICSPPLRRRFVIILILMFAQQYAGHFAVYNYVDGVFLPTEMIWKNLAIIHEVYFICLILTTMVLIFLIDSVGRRKVLLIGFGVCCFCSAILPTTIHFQITHPWLSDLNTFLIVTFLHGYFIGPGTVPPILTSELFLQSTRCSGVAASGVVFWLCRFIAVMTMGGVQAAFQAYTSFLYLPMGLTTFLLIYKFVPETKKKTFREIRKLIASQETQKISAT